MYPPFDLNVSDEESSWKFHLSMVSVSPTVILWSKVWGNYSIDTVSIQKLLFWSTAQIDVNKKTKLSPTHQYLVLNMTWLNRIIARHIPINHIIIPSTIYSYQRMISWTEHDQVSSLPVIDSWSRLKNTMRCDWCNNAERRARFSQCQLQWENAEALIRNQVFLFP